MGVTNLHRGTEHFVNLSADNVTIDTGTIELSGLEQGTNGQLLVAQTSSSPLWKSVSGDVTMAASGATTVTDLTITSEARGDILRRGASAWERHAAKTSGQILVGDGTDIVSVAVSGDVTLAANGAVTIANDAVESAMIAETIVQTATVNMTNGEALALATPKELVAAPGAGKYIIVDEVTAFNNFGSIAFAFSDAMSIKYTNDSGDSACTDIPEVAFCEAGADAVATTHGIDCVPVANAPIVAVVGTNPTSGDGDFDFEVKYRIVSFTT